MKSRIGELNQFFAGLHDKDRNNTFIGDIEMTSGIIISEKGVEASKEFLGNKKVVMT